MLKLCSYSNPDWVVLAEGQTQQFSQVTFNKTAKAIQQRKHTSFSKWCWTIGYPLAKTWTSTQISHLVVQSLSHIRLLATPWFAARQASLSITNSWRLLKLKCLESVMPSISWSSVVPFSSCLQSFPASRSFPTSSLHQVAKALELQLQQQSFQWIFRIDFL